MTATRREIDRTDWRTFRNDSGETIPGGAIIEITGSERVAKKNAFVATKPTSTGKQRAFNSPFDVSVGGYGKCSKTFAFVRYKAIIPEGETAPKLPKPGDEWGAAADSWDIQAKGDGVKIEGQVSGGEAGRCRASLLSGGGGSEIAWVIIRAKIEAATVEPGLKLVPWKIPDPGLEKLNRESDGKYVPSGEFIGAVGEEIENRSPDELSEPTHADPADPDSKEFVYFGMIEKDGDGWFLRVEFCEKVEDVAISA